VAAASQAPRCSFGDALDQIEETALARAVATVKELVEIRESRRRAGAKDGRRTRAFVFETYDHPELDLDVMVVVEKYKGGKLEDTAELRELVDLDQGVMIHLVTCEEWNKWENEDGTTHHEACARGVVLFDDLETRAEPGRRAIRKYQVSMAWESLSRRPAPTWRRPWPGSSNTSKTPVASEWTPTSRRRGLAIALRGQR
jgi:hypothetical protein